MIDSAAAHPGPGAASVGEARGPSTPLLFAARAVVTTPSMGDWTPRTRSGQSVLRGELLGTHTGSSGAVQELRSDWTGQVVHLRRGGNFAAGTAVVILATNDPRP